MNCFFIPHGTVNTKNQWFDGKTKEWKNLPSQDSVSSHVEHFFSQQVFTSEYEENNCHEDGVIKCNRCYRRHYVIENFDLLCDGCTSLLKEHYTHLPFVSNLLIPFVLTKEEKTRREALRSNLDGVLKASTVVWQDKQVVIVRELLKNNGDIVVVEVGLDSTKKQNQQTVNVTDLTWS